MAGEHLLLQPTSDAAAVSTTTSIISLSHTHQVISLKLINTNYLYWRMQMLLYLLGQGVFGFVDGSNTCPPSHILARDGISLQVNPLFLRWKQQGQLILSVFLSSLSMEVLHLVVGCQSSYLAWRTLERALASTSNSHIMQLHGSLQDLRQGDESITQFMQKAKALFDELVAACRPVSLEDFNLYVFCGLRGEFPQLSYKSYYQGGIFIICRSSPHVFPFDNSEQIAKVSTTTPTSPTNVTLPILLNHPPPPTSTSHPNNPQHLALPLQIATRPQPPTTQTTHST
jgi:hypothetical protein